MLTQMDKCLVALLLAGANVARTRYDIDFGLTDQMASDIIGFVTAAAVWLIPNKAK